MNTPSTSFFDNIIVGSGFAGMSAGFELQRRNHTFHILEGASFTGGRARLVDPSFNVDINLEIGGSFVHDVPNLQSFADSVGASPPDSMLASLKNTPYWLYDDGWVSERSAVSNDNLWINNTWHEFLQTNIYPSVQNDITFGCTVTTIDYSDPAIIQLTCADQRVFTANKVIIAVSPGILKAGSITFTPTLPAATQSAINGISYLSAIKMYIEFDTDFYSERGSFSLYGQNSKNPSGYDEYFCWDAALAQGTQRNILGCLLSGASAQSNAGVNVVDILDNVLFALDEAFGSQATSSYVQHTIKDWSIDPFARGAWTDYDVLGGDSGAVYDAMADSPIENRIFFAGEYLSRTDQFGNMDTAAVSGQVAACLLTGDMTSAWDGPCGHSSAGIRGTATMFGSVFGAGVTTAVIMFVLMVVV